jgi:hypothetical protein
MTRAQVSALLYDVAQVGHYTFDKTYLLKKWLRQAIREGLVQPSDVRRYTRTSMKRHWRVSPDKQDEP